MADTTYVSKVTNIVLAWAQTLNDWAYKGRSPNFATTTGSANAQVLTLATGSLYTSESDGDLFTFKAGFTNTAATTIQVMPAGGSNTAVAAQVGGVALTGGEIQSGKIYQILRLGTTWQVFPNGTFIQSGTGAVTKDVQTELRSNVKVSQFLTDAQLADVQARTRTLDVSAAIRNADAQAALTGRGLEFGRGAYRCDSSPFSGSTANRKWYGCGDNGATLWKHFNGTFIPITGCNGIEFHNMHLYGDQANFTGKGVVFSGVASYPRFPGTILEGFQSTFLEFGADSGYGFSCTGANFYTDRINAQSALTIIAMAADDTGAAHRHFVDVGVDGDLDLSGALTSVVNSSRFRNLITTNTTSVISVGDNSWAMTGGSATINATNATVVGNRLGGSVTLASGSSGSFVGNHPTSGTLTNSAAAGNWVILHREGGSNVYKIGQHYLDSTTNPAAPGCIPNVRTQFVSDAGLSWVYGTHGSAVIYQAPITASRTVTLATSGPTPPQGAEVCVTRQASCTGAFDVIVGGTAITLAPGEWVKFVFDGSAWPATEGGTIPT